MQVLGGGYWNLMSEGLYRILLLAHALRSSSCFCSLRWARSEAFDSLGQLLALLCMPLGGKARSQGNMCAALGAAVRT